MGIVFFLMLLATSQARQLECGDNYNAESYRWEVFESYLRYITKHPGAVNEAKEKVIYIDCPASVPCDCSEPVFEYNDDDYEEDYETG